MIKKKCNACGSELIMAKKEHVPFANHIEEVYEERCANCHNMVYGYSKPLRWML